MTGLDRDKRGGGWLGVAGAVLLVAALVYSGWMMSHTLDGDESFFKRGYLGHNGARYSIMARNVLRCDVSEALFAPLLNPEGEIEPDPYLHHPPLLHWVMALVFHLFGETEDHARLIPLVFTLLNLVLIFFLGRRILGSAFWGGVSSLMAAALPMTSFYGSHIDVQGSPLVCCILACVLSYLRWIDSGRRAWLTLALVMLVLGTLFDWPALYLCLLIPLHYKMIHRPSGITWRLAVRRTAPIILTGILLFVLLAAWLSFASTNKGTSLLASLLDRVLPSTFLDIGSPWEYFVRSLTDYCLPFVHSLYPWPFWALLVLGCLLGWITRVRRQEKAENSLMWLLFLLGTIHVVLFPTGGVLFHDYWVFLYVPWLAFACALALRRITLLAGGGNRFLKGAGFMGTALAAAAAIWAGHSYSMSRFNNEYEEFVYVPYFLGTAIHDTAEPGEAVLTNADLNFYDEESTGDRYVLRFPELSYYADRVVRGRIFSQKDFQTALERRDDFTYFAFVRDIKYPEYEILHLYLKDRYPLHKKMASLQFFRLK